MLYGCFYGTTQCNYLIQSTSNTDLFGFEALQPSQLVSCMINASSQEKGVSMMGGGLNGGMNGGNQLSMSAMSSQQMYSNVNKSSLTTQAPFDAFSGIGGVGDMNSSINGNVQYKQKNY